MLSRDQPYYSRHILVHIKKSQARACSETTVYCKHSQALCRQAFGANEVGGICPIVALYPAPYIAWVSGIDLIWFVNCNHAE